MAPVSVLCLSGSSRAGSFNTKLAALVARRVALRDADATLISLADYPLPLMDEDYEREHGIPENARKLAELICAYDAVFIASPEYNASLTPLLKNAIDWVSRVKTPLGSAYKNRIFALGAASPGGLGGMRALPVLRQSLVGMLGLVISEQISVGGAGDAFSDDGDLASPRTDKMLDGMIDRLLEISGAISPNR
ncbi:NADPH-dependent FMN reductase [Coralliovum pocilloporae]|uniref:NADPH-dependent FMN reductase n=1 Tax=Coralliovum pocilloporae TaxID=3066369 RepID=UPI0033074011